MTKKTRYFLVASAAILVIGLAGGLVAYYGFSQGALFRASGPEELHYVPHDVALLAYANVREVMDSAFRRELMKMGSGEQQRGRQELRDRTGIDAEKDIDRVVAYLTATPDQQKAQGRGLVLARGRFDQKRIESLIREHGGAVEDYRGKRIMKYVPGQTSAKSSTTDAANEMALAFIQPGLVALGSGPLVRTAVDLGRGGPNITRNDEFMRMVREVDTGNAWAVGRFDTLTSQIPVPPAVGGQLPPLRLFSASGRVNGGLSAAIRAEATDEASAQQLRDVVRGFVALAKLQAGSKPEWQSMLKSLELGGTGKTVSLLFSLTPEAVGALVPGAGRPGPSK